MVSGPTTDWPIVLVNTYHAGIVFIEQNEAKIVDISEMLMAISRITEPIPGMFVLNLMHFSLWFQI